MEYKFRNDTVILIGDSHDTSRVYDIINIDIPNGSDSVHVGDIGLGFGSPKYALEDARTWLKKVNDLCGEINVNFYMISGNHDNPAVWELPDIYSNITLLKTGDIGIFPNGKKTLFVGGGISVDRYSRKEGVNYWSDELTPYLENVEKTDFVFSHDCPEYFNHGTNSLIKSYAWYCDRDNTLVEDALKQRENMSDIVERSGAKVLFSGHFHNNRREEKNGIYYRCLDINERFEFDSNKEYKL